MTIVSLDLFSNYNVSCAFHTVQSATFCLKKLNAEVCTHVRTCKIQCSFLMRALLVNVFFICIYICPILKEYPSNLRASTVRSTWVTFSWDRFEKHWKFGRATGYQIMFTDGENYKHRVIHAQECTAYTFLELTPCTSYGLRVAALFNGLPGTWSPSVEVTTPPDGKGNKKYALRCT